MSALIAARRQLLAERIALVNEHGMKLGGDARRLWVLHLSFNFFYDSDARINERAALVERIRECAEDGRILVVESGMDCDCVRYAGLLRSCPATVRDFYALHDQVMRAAEGPVSLFIDRPSNARCHAYHSRDLALEAHEDGHPHCVSTVRYDEYGK